MILFLISVVNWEEMHFEICLLAKKNRGRIKMREIHRIVTVVPEG